MGLFLRNMIFTGLIIITVSCSGQGTKKDNRIVLSSESADYLIIPEGPYEGDVISRSKLAVFIADHFKSISRVYDISFTSELHSIEAAFNIVSLGILPALDGADYFTASFAVETTSGHVFENIKCMAVTSTALAIANRNSLAIGGCESNQASLDKPMMIPFHKITLQGQNRPTSF